MSLMTNTFERMVLNTMLGTTAQAPAQVYVALFLSSPTESGQGGTEVSYQDYARQPLNLSAPVVNGTTVTVSNTEDIAFVVPNTSAGTVTHVAIMDAVTGGNVLVYAAIPNPIALTMETQPKFLIGDIVLTMAGGNMHPNFKAKVLNLLRGTNIAGFEPYLALYGGDPTASGAELNGSGYARLPLVFEEPAEQVSGQMRTVNTNQVATAAATSDWGIWTHGVIMDGATGGNPVWYRANAGSYNMNNGARANVAAGAVVIGIN